MMGSMLPAILVSTSSAETVETFSSSFGFNPSFIAAALVIVFFFLSTLFSLVPMLSKEQGWPWSKALPAIFGGVCLSTFGVLGAMTILTGTTSVDNVNAAPMMKPKVGTAVGEKFDDDAGVFMKGDYGDQVRYDPESQEYFAAVIAVEEDEDGSLTATEYDVVVSLDGTTVFTESTDDDE